MTKRHLFVLGAACSVLAFSAISYGEESSPKPDVDKIIDSTLGSMVRVEYTLRYDRGEAPVSGADSDVIPYYGIGDYVTQERPLVVPGFLVSPTKVVTADSMMHPRFIERIMVRFGEEVVTASVSAHSLDRCAVILDLEGPLPGTKPLVFEKQEKQRLYQVLYEDIDGAWGASIGAGVETFRVWPDGSRKAMVHDCGVLVTGQGEVQGLSMKDYLSPSDDWKGSPLDWPQLNKGEFDSLLAKTRKIADSGLLRVGLSFRSPARSASDSPFGYFGRRSDEGAMERNAVGVVIGQNQILVLANLKPKVTARLQKIMVHPVQGEPIEAKFVASLADYGCFVAETAGPMLGAIEFADADVLDWRDELLPAVDIRLQGRQWVVYMGHQRISSYSRGWRGQIFPDVREQAATKFLFSRDGKLVAFPICRREKAAVDNGWSYHSDDCQTTPVAYVRSVLDELPEGTDPSNVPVCEKEENRVAWLGMELQPLDQELARANGVSHLCGDGSSGALVSYVYPDSPASEAGIRPGSIVLRIHVEGYPKPLDIQVERQDHFYLGIDWDELDGGGGMFGGMYGEMPPPWPSVENRLTRALTDVGFGTECRLEYYQDKRTQFADFVVSQGPPHYEASPRFKSQMLGFTVRDLTYEVRRYFQKSAEDAGVVVSKVEPGGKGAVAGIRPYEIIVKVNDQPVASVQEFEEAIEGQSELRLSIKRLTKDRLVRIMVD